MEERQPTRHYLEILATSIHRSRRNNHFLIECVSTRTFPKHTFIPKNVLKYVCWSKNRIRIEREKILNRSLEEGRDKLKEKELKFDTVLNNFCFLNKIDETGKNELIKNIFNKIKKSEFERDKKRDKKFQKLKNEKESKSRIMFKITNLTEEIIPDQILKIIQRGPSFPCGGSPQTIALLGEFDNLLDFLKKNKQFLELPDITKVHLKAKLVSCHERLTKAFGNDRSNKYLREFLNRNKNIVIVLADKTHEQIIMYREKYLNALTKEFLDPKKFKQLSHDPLTEDFENFKKLLRSVEDYTNEIFYIKNKPILKLKTAYGLGKTHKNTFLEENQMRPIVSSVGSMTSNFQKNFLDPILSKFKAKFTVKSSKEFSLWFKSQKFDLTQCDYVSLDICKLYPSIDTKLLIKFLEHEIYNVNRPHDILPRFRDKENNLMKPIPKTKLRPILKGVLEKYTAFRCGEKVFRQIGGLAMGDSCSPKLADLFLHYLEHEPVQKLLSEGLIMGYRRYLDDIFLVYRKNKLDEILKIFQNLHEKIKITVEKPVDTRLKFLDFEIYTDQEKGSIEIKSYNKDTVPMHFSDCAPLNMKKGLLVGELVRSTMKNSQNNNLILDFEKIKEKYICQEYPKTLIEESIERVKMGRNSKIDWEREKSENPSRNFTMKIPYTSDKVKKVSNELRKSLKAYLPDFNLHYAHKTITVRNTIIQNLCPKLDSRNSLNSVYMFTCDCGDRYIGETENLFNRVQDHQQPSKDTAIYNHTSQCPNFTENFNKSYVRNIFENRFEFLLGKFQILHKNLKYKERTQYEAIEIRLKNPVLNRQVKHKSISII